jgi:hypothetical protein
MTQELTGIYRYIDGDICISHQKLFLDIHTQTIFELGIHLSELVINIPQI